jgi:hypothetical protein
MTQLQQAERFMGYLQTYNATKKLQMDADTLQDLKGLYGQIFGVYNINVSCATCVVQYLDNLSAWYERQIKIDNTTFSQVAQEKAPCKKCGKNKSK